MKREVYGLLNIFSPVVVGCVVVTCVILLHPFFPHLHMFNAATTALTLTILTGFMDDVLDLRGRTKIMLSFLAALPLIVAYDGPTNVIVPKPLRGFLGDSVELQYAYLLYMMFLAVFFTNGINIYAGINGLEVGQSVVIASSILVHNVIQLGANDCDQVAILYSASTCLPFLGSSLALLYHNWYPSRVFVGDSYTYTAGMAFAVIAILGKISKTVMLFFIPQFINYFMSVPQIVGILPCPRHRLPQYIPKTDKMRFSTFELNGKKYMNLTLINLCLKVLGDMNEQTLCILLLAIQVMCSVVAFGIRYYLSLLFYA